MSTAAPPPMRSAWSRSVLCPVTPGRSPSVQMPPSASRAAWPAPCPPSAFQWPRPASALWPTATAPARRRALPSPSRPMRAPLAPPTPPATSSARPVGQPCSTRQPTRPSPRPRRCRSTMSLATPSMCRRSTATACCWATRAPLLPPPPSASARSSVSAKLHLPPKHRTSSRP